MSKIAVFDFDGTVIRGDSIVAMQHAARAKGYIGLPALAYAGLCGMLYHLRLLSPMQSKHVGHAFLTRLSKAERTAFLQEFARDLVNRAYPEAIQRMEAHRAAGERVVLCSASGECYMRYVAAMLPVDALLCTPCTEDGDMLGPNCRGKEKVIRVREWLTEQGLPRDCIGAAYGDTAGDAYILRESAHPVLVNPKAKLIRALPQAERVKWGGC